ncbi:Sortase family protein [compost metagenome]
MPPATPKGVPVAAVPLTVTSTVLGFDKTPLATMQAGDSGTEVVPPIDTQNPVNSFKPYWIENFGMPGAGAADTVYIIGHACSAQCDPNMLAFNRLIDMKPGDIISLTTKAGEVSYRVTRSVTYDQEAPASEKGGTWEKQPDQLVLVSCNPANFHGKSTSVFAELVK